MSERLKFVGRLEEKRLLIEKLELQLAGLRDSIRDHLDPFEPIKDLKLDIVAQQALEMAELQIELKTAREEMQAIKKVLGKQ